MKLKVDGEEVEYGGIAGFFLAIGVYLLAALIIIWTFLVTLFSFLLVILILLSPFIVIGLVIAWAL